MADARASKLVEFIFGKASMSEKIEADSSIPYNLLNEDFRNRLADVLSVREFLVVNRWQDFFDHNCRDMLSSHESYLSYVMFVCLYEHQCNSNKFDSFISVCAIIMHFSIETIFKTWVDFRDLNPDIIMAFYRNSLKKSFHKRKDFFRFVEYIRGHKYLEWNSDKNNHISLDDPNASVSVGPDLNDLLMKELISYRAFDKVSNDTTAAMQVTGVNLAWEVISSTSAKLPDLPSEPVLIERLVAYGEIQKADKDEVRERGIADLALEAPHGYSSLNSDAKTNNFAKQQEDIAQHENIIQAVIRHNQLKNSGHENSNNQIHGEADCILGHLKNTIKSLIEVLDECNQK